MKLPLLKNRLKLLAGVMFLLSSCISFAQGGAATYSFTATTTTYAALTGTTNVGGLVDTSDDVLSSATDIGFTFNFAGTNYTQFKASSNGFITFNTASTDTFFTNNETNAGTSKPILMPLWDDLQSTSRVRYVLSGTSPNRIMKIEYTGNKWNYNATGDVIKFQVWLYETSNRIEYRYQRSATAVNTGSATIGIYDANGTYLTLSGSGASPTASSTTFTTTISAKPANNQIFRFEPGITIAASVASLTKFTACNLTASASQNFVVSGSSLTADIVITAPTGFEVSTDNTAFFNTRTLTQSGGMVAATTVYARMKSLAANPTAGNISITSTGAETKNISVSGKLLSPTGVSAGSDVASCSGASVTLSANASGEPVSQVLSTINNATGFATMTTNDANRWGFATSNNAGGTADELQMQWFNGDDPTLVSVFIESPLLDASNYTALSMTFKHNLNFYQGTAPLALQTSTDGTTWTTRWNLNATGDVAANTVTVDLSAVNDTSFYYRFLYDGNIFNIDVWYIDDVIISGTYALPATYSWTSTPSGFTSSLKNPIVTPTATTTYTLAATLDGCTITDDVVVTIASTTWNGTWSNGIPTSTTAAIIEDDFTSSASLTACSLTVTNNSDVIISTDNSVILSGVLTVNTGSSFTLNNNANLIQGGVINENVGEITVNRNSSSLKRQDYTLWSSPTTGSQTLQQFSPATLSTRFYTYNTNTNFLTATSSSNTFELGKGYLIRMPNNHPSNATIWTDGAFVGVPNNGTISLTMVDGGAGERFNLVGNPYPSPINAFDFIGNDTNIVSIKGTLYFWRKTNDANSDSYLSWTSLGMTAATTNSTYVDPQGVIQTGQGFFVEGTGDGTSVVFNNGMRVDDHANQFFKTTATTERHRIWLNATNTAGLSSQTLVGYASNATNDLDRTDGKYINDGPIALTSIVNDTPYAIQGRSLPFDSNDIIPMQFKATTAGTYTIAIDRVDGLFADSQDIFLRDAATGVDHNLKTSGYTFAVEAGVTNDRFYVVYSAALSTTNPTLDANSIVIYKNDNQGFVVNSGNNTMSSVKVFDIRGRLLTSVSNINANQTVVTAGQSNEVLLVQVTSTDGATVTKKVVR